MQQKRKIIHKIKTQKSPPIWKFKNLLLKNLSKKGVQTEITEFLKNNNNENTTQCFLWTEENA